MAFNGSGTFNRIHNWQQDAANGINISAPEMDGEDNGFAAGLSLVLVRDGQAPMTGPLDMGSQQIKNAANITLNGATVPVNGVNLFAANSLGFYTNSIQALAIDATQGIYTAGATGNGKGSGTVNATGFYINGNVFAGTSAVVKPSNTTRTLTTSPAADPHLTLAVASGKTYRVRAFLLLSGAGAGIKAGFGTSGASSGLQAATYQSYNNNATVAPSGTGALSAATTTVAVTALLQNAGFDAAIIEGVFTTSASGNVYVQWAQNSSSGVGTTIVNGSTIELTPLN